MLNIDFISIGKTAAMLDSCHKMKSIQFCWRRDLILKCVRRQWVGYIHLTQDGIRIIYACLPKNYNLAAHCTIDGWFKFLTHSNGIKQCVGHFLTCSSTHGDGMRVLWDCSRTTNMPIKCPGNIGWPCIHINQQLCLHKDLQFWLVLNLWSISEVF